MHIGSRRRVGRPQNLPGAVTRNTTAHVQAVEAATHVIGVAICADLTRPGHPRRYAELRADIYAAAVCITPGGYDADAALLAETDATSNVLVIPTHDGPRWHGSVAGIWSGLN